ncbi:MAG: TetR/AcrR family transcriptional regulator, partial [Bacteroidota bacterium]|nr:TetR/AcrR family transcriptional regulator [Bacteroidota bacterium]MDX5430307.1 TetR/AcrR family transcriptional regulator [Bacteroidota bacterium]MDX5469068.1 TetR/AcrR family transcriptional regulator [Bacteroidota bacterium]
RNGKQPASVFLFCEELGISEAEFYSQFTSFEALEIAWVKTQMEGLFAELQSDETFIAYSAREKYTALLYAWVEKCTQDRSFWLLVDSRKSRTQLHVPLLSAMKKTFLSMAETIVREGYDQGEIMRRPLLSEKYPDAMWLQFLWIHEFWLRDISTEFQRTDAAIEKSVRFVFDMMAHSALDSALDLGKFLLGSRA